MRIVEALCKHYNCGVLELLKILGVSSGKIENYIINRPQSKGLRRFNAEKRAAKLERSRARVKFYNNLSRKRFKRGRKLNGEIFTFSRQIEDNIELSIPLVDKIYELGGKYAQKLDGKRTYVAEEGDETARTKTALGANNIKVITLDELKELLND